MSGSLLVDIVLVIVALGAMASGWRQGGLSAVLSLGGVLLGGYLAILAIPTVLDFAASQGHESQGIRFVVSLVLITVGVLLGYTVGTSIGMRLRDNIRSRQVLKAESAVGAIVQVITTLTVVWLILVPLVGTKNNEFARSVKDSAVLNAVESAAPEFLQKFPTRVATFISDSGFPVITDPLDSLPQQEIAAPNPELQNSSVMQSTRDSIVRVVGEAEQCSRLIQGSGFAVTPDTIMTNAHVVAGTDRVKLDTTQGMVNATVTYYNPTHDVALLKVEDGVTLPALQWAEQNGAPGDDSIVMGFPQGGPFQATPARIRQLFTVSGPDIYADTRVDRQAYAVRGTVVQGNSGGPLLNERGEVLGLIFGADVNQTDTGYALSREEVMNQIQDAEDWVDPAATGACVLH